MHLHYTHNQSTREKAHRQFRHRRALVVLAIFAVLIAGSFITFDIIRNAWEGQPVSDIASSKSVAADQVYRTNYFEFVDDNGNWELDPKASTPSKFTYFKRRSGLTEHQLVVYVNTPPNNLFTASRAFPATIKNGNAFSPTAITQHCRTAYAKNEPMRQHDVKIDNTTFPCTPDTPQYSVVMAQIGGGPMFTLRRRNGTTATYVIWYRDLRTNTDERVITNIATSFKAI